MKRREILIGLAALATQTPAWAQTGARLPIVGFVGLASAQIDNHMLGHFQAGLRELGRIEGRTIAIEARIADGNIDKGHELISELVMLPVDVFLSGQLGPHGQSLTQYSTYAFRGRAGVDCSLERLRDGLARFLES